MYVFFTQHRKFADIEASNQRLASALYPAVEKNTSSQESDTTDESLNAAAPSNQSPTGGISKSKNMASNNSKQGRVEQREASKRHKLVEILTAESPMNHEGGFHGDTGEDPASEHPPSPSHHTPSAHTQLTHRDSVTVGCDHQMDVSPTFSANLHQSLDYCNFPEIPENVEMHGDESESQWEDVVDFFGTDSSSSSSNAGDFFDFEAYFESICLCKSDSSEQTVDGQPLEWSSDQWEETCSNAWRDEEDVDFTVPPEETYTGASSCPQIERQTVFIQSQQPSAVKHSSTQHSSAHSSCTLTDSQHFNFEGVAQSFSVPPHIQYCSVPTLPPHEDDWLFALKDKAVSEFWE